MSWIAVLMKVPPEVKELDDFPDNFTPEPLSSKSEVLSLLAQLFPDADFTDPTWVTLEQEEYVVEFMVGKEDPVMTLGFRPHGNDSVMEVLQLLCERTGWRAFDTSSGEFIEFDDDPAEGFRAWREYAKRALGT